jgi:membrane-associated phospholipid phosphatase
MRAQVSGIQEPLLPPRQGGLPTQLTEFLGFPVHRNITILSRQASAKMNDLQKWIAGFVLTAVLVVICYLWIDRPVALLAHDVHRIDLLVPTLRGIPVLAAPVAALALLVLSVRALLNRPLTPPYIVILLCTVSFFVTEGLKTYLKVAFGRPWPESWMGPHISFIRDGAYGFQPFHGGPAYTAFPSGHIAAVSAVLSVLWVWYPKFRPLYVLGIVATAIILVGINFHFVSDVIAGIFLGTSVGWITTAVWQAGVHPPADTPTGKIRGQDMPSPYPAPASATPKHLPRARPIENHDRRRRGAVDEISPIRRRNGR